MSDLTKRKLFSISNAVKYYAYSVVDENGEWNEEGTKLAGILLGMIILAVAYIGGT